ncbi:DNA repair and recombination RAD5B, partial, partial [Olea europaea subsp. europaea]
MARCGGHEGEPVVPRVEAAASAQVLECSICYDAPPMIPVQLDCGHVYCRGCIQRWFRFKHKCPMCRTRFELEGWRYLDPVDGPGLWPFEKILYGEGRGRGRVYGILWCDGSITVEPKLNIPRQARDAFEDAE